MLAIEGDVTVEDGQRARAYLWADHNVDTITREYILCPPPAPPPPKHICYPVLVHLEPVYVCVCVIYTHTCVYITHTLFLAGPPLHLRSGTPGSTG